MNAVFDFVGDVRDNLHRFPEILPRALIVQYGLVHLAAGKVVESREFYIRESLIMPEIEIRFGAIISYKHFPMLKRIDIKIGIELLNGDFQATVFQQCAERRGGESLAERTNHTAGDKNVFHEWDCLFANNFSTLATSSGTSTPTLPALTRTTAREIPASSARNCSRLSAFSSAEMGNFTRRNNVAR